MKYKNIFYCTNEPVKNIGNIRNYLIENTENLVTFHYQLGYSGGKSYIEKFNKGSLIYKKEFGNKKSNVLFNNLSYYFIFLYTLLVHVKRDSFVIVISPVFCFLSSIFGFLKTAKYVYWIEDYFPPSESIFMKFYSFLADYYSKKLKFVIYISPPIQKIYRRKGVKNFKKLVTLGIRQVSIKKVQPSKIIKLGFIGIIRKEQGLDLAFKFLQTSSNVVLEVVGDGYDLNFYKSMSKRMGLSKKVIFRGANFNPVNIAKRWDIALALYENDINNFSSYSEPSKIKTYLSFGLPVISTKTTYFYKEIEKHKAGIIINENVSDLSKAIKDLTANYPKYLRGVSLINDKYYYKKWYDRTFNFLRSNR